MRRTLWKQLKKQLPAKDNSNNSQHIQPFRPNRWSGFYFGLSAANRIELGILLYAPTPPRHPRPNPQRGIRSNQAALHWICIIQPGKSFIADPIAPAFKPGIKSISLMLGFSHKKEVIHIRLKPQQFYLNYVPGINAGGN